jgi:hypothetical protein
MSRFGIVLSLLFLTVAAPARAEGESSRGDTRATGEATVHLHDGSVIVGTITEQDERRLKIVTGEGVVIEVAREAIERIESGRHPATRDEPVADETRLFLGPTGSPLRQGSGYFSDHWVFFPGVAYGATDNLTLAGGVSLIPGIDDQILYFTPKLGTRLSDSAAVSVGGLLARGPDDTSLTVGYVVSTFGSPDLNLTAGVGAGRVGGFESSETQALILLGGTARLSKRLSFLSENWILPGEDFELYSAGLRFHGDRLTVDLGLILNEEIVDAGFPVPWLSFSYHFGGGRR